jgi:predicted small secreted protein
MKKILAIALFATVFTACNNEAENKTTPEDTLSKKEVTTTYTSADGDLNWKESKLYIYKNGEWVLVEKDITLADGTVITVNGEVKKGNKVIQLKEGEKVNTVGEFIDNTGKKIENAWDATKEGVSNAADKVKEGAKETGEKIKDGVKETGAKIKEGAEKSAEKVDAGVQKAKEDLKKKL